MKKYDLYSKRDPAKNFSPLPNEVFYLGLSYGAIAVYGYLMHIEDRKTFQSYAGYNTIGRAVKMSANTVLKYVLELEDKHLIRTEPTTVVTRDGRKRNGTLRYHIRPIQEAVDYYHEQQLRQVELDTERQRAQTRLSRLCAAQEPLPAAGWTHDTSGSRTRRVRAVWPDVRSGWPQRFAKRPSEPGGRKKCRIKAWRLVPPRRVTPAPQCGPGDGKHRGLEPFAVHFEENCANRRMASIFPAWHWIWH
nr:hypothetical protein [uncultured Oscillibacter sp.]